MKLCLKVLEAYQRRRTAWVSTWTRWFVYPSIYWSFRFCFLFFVLFLQVQFKGKTIKLNLRINTLLFGSDFTTERYKEDGTIERTKSSDLHCYLVGETESFYSSVALSDCDGLVSIVLSRIYAWSDNYNSFALTVMIRFSTRSAYLLMVLQERALIRERRFLSFEIAQCVKQSSDVFSKCNISR